jgi:hypothetical protein
VSTQRVNANDVAIHTYLQTKTGRGDVLQQTFRDQPGGLPLLHVIFKERLRHNLFNVDIVQVHDVLVGFKSFDGFPSHSISPERLTRVEKFRFSRMVETSWTETSASALDDDAAGGVEAAGALINKGKLHKTTEVQIVSNPSPTIYIYYKHMYFWTNL